MLSERAESGQSTSLDVLSAGIDLEALGIRGQGCLRIDETGHSPRMTWIPGRNNRFTLFSQDDGGGGETSHALERFKADTVALGGGSDPILDAPSLGCPDDQSDAYTSRMKYLRNEAVDYGYELNVASEIDFRQFVGSAPELRRCNLVLMDNGNLRAIWKDGHGSRLALQFLGNRMVQYVIFKLRKQGQPISRVAGRDSLEGLVRQIGAFDLSSLLYE